ncbi:hypothetical protein [Arenivirga flava]|uniref:Uncharacterized protein n=1 Tax=Arenivirga flava TaxID=1930060 RepID=A0AA37UL51_9MICO|nr:hypothetical protein [Arenivirga flava]GMA27051.1 hypothetical protein GCM10025874_03040 [Arenivirga flava]
MARSCIVCTHPERVAVDAALVAGETQAAVASTYSLPPSSVSRHFRGHLDTALVGFSGNEAGEGLSLIDRLVRSLGDLEAVRRQALTSGNSGHVIRAAAASNALIQTLLDRLGVDDLSVATDLRTAHFLALSVGAATRVNPETGRLIAARLRDHGLHDDAAALDAVAAKAEQQQFENRQNGIEK